MYVVYMKRSSLFLEVAEQSEIIEHIYYDKNDETDSLIVLQRSSDGHGNLVNMLC